MKVYYSLTFMTISSVLSMKWVFESLILNRLCVLLFVTCPLPKGFVLYGICCSTLEHPTLNLDPILWGSFSNHWRGPHTQLDSKPTAITTCPALRMRPLLVIYPRGCYTTKENWEKKEEIPLPVRLERDSIIASEFTQILLEFSEKLLVPLSLVQRHKGVDVCKFFPCDRLKSKRRKHMHMYTL